MVGRGVGRGEQGMQSGGGGGIGDFDFFSEPALPLRLWETVCHSPQEYSCSVRKASFKQTDLQRLQNLRELAKACCSSVTVIQSSLLKWERKRWSCSS